MTETSKHKLLFTTFLLSALLISSVYSVLIPCAHAEEMTIQQKGLSILSNVVGLDLAKYEVSAKEYSPDTQASYLGVVSQNSVEYTLTSSENKFRLQYTFANENLQMIQVLEDEDTRNLAKPPIRFNTLAAEKFLSRYQKYTADPLYGELKATLVNVDAGKNLTKTSGNIRLEVTVSDEGYTNFRWYYIANDAIAPYSKFVTLEFKDGFLKIFVNNWQLYNVGDTSINVSKDKALAIALETAKAHQWSVNLDADTLDTKNFNDSNLRWESLVFDHSLNIDKARNENLLTLYPVWRVGIALDKWYGYMYGIEVDIWADTGEVRSVQEAWSTLPPPENAPASNASNQASANLNMLIAIPAIAVATGMTLLLVNRRKKMQSFTLLKRSGLKTGAILSCILISTMILLAPVTTVNATTRGAAVWGSQSDGAINQDGSHWRKSQNEIGNQTLVAIDIASYFQNYGGYTGNNGINHQGSRNPGSTAGQILGDIGTLQYANDYVAVVDFDHGVGGYPINAPPGEEHYMFEDNTGTVIGTQASHTTDWNHGVYDMSIYQLTQQRKIIFSFISACQSADTTRLGQGLIDTQWVPNPRAIGMPFAFTHGRYVVDKSETPSFTISQHMSNDGYDDPDWSPQVYIGFPYGSASLEQGIPFGGGGGNPYRWWVTSFFYNALYYDYSVNQALDSASAQFMGGSFRFSPLRTGFPAWWWNMGPPVPACTLAVYGNGNIHLKQFTSPVDLASVPSVGGPTVGGTGVSYQFSAFSTDPYGHNVKYRFDWGDGSPLTETGWYSDGATAYASHSWGSGGLYSVRVQAQCPNSGWSSWSNLYYVNIGYLTSQLTTYAYNQYGNPGYVPLYIDGAYVGTTGYAYSVLLGSRQIYVESPLYDGYYYHVFDHYVYDGIGYAYNPLAVLVTGDKTCTAYYYSYY